MRSFLSLLLSFVFSMGVVSAASKNEPEPIVWGAKVSPFVRKVLIAMEYKKLPYQNREILPTLLLKALNEEVPKEFQQASPLGKIPAYQEGDFSVADSAVIVAYLEKMHPEQALYPQDPKLLARALWLEKYGDTAFSLVTHTVIVESVIKPQVLKTASDTVALQKAIEQELPVVLEYLEAQLQTPWAGRYFIGDQMTIADIGVTTHLVSLQAVGITIDAKKWPHLAAYFEKVTQEPSFKKVLQS